VSVASNPDSGVTTADNGSSGSGDGGGGTPPLRLRLGYGETVGDGIMESFFTGVELTLSTDVVAMLKSANWVGQVSLGFGVGAGMNFGSLETGRAGKTGVEGQIRYRASAGPVAENVQLFPSPGNQTSQVGFKGVKAPTSTAIIGGEVKAAIEGVVTVRYNYYEYTQELMAMYRWLREKTIWSQPPDTRSGSSNPENNMPPLQWP
jgi:hypothetical protein